MSEGNVIVASVGTFGSGLREFSLAEGATLAELLDMADLDGTGYTFKVAGNGEVETSYVLRNGDKVVLVQAVKNGR